MNMHHNFINAYYSTKDQYQQNKRIFKAYPRGQKYMNTVRINEGFFPSPPFPLTPWEHGRLLRLYIETHGIRVRNFQSASFVRVRTFKANTGKCG